MGRDVEAICEAALAALRFVLIKHVNSKRCGVCIVHDRGFVKARSARANQLRGLLAECAIVMHKGRALSRNICPGVLEDGEHGLPHSSENYLRNSSLTSGPRSSNERTWATNQGVAPAE